jgi:hypothetical protein
VAAKVEPYPDAKALEVFSRAVLLRATILSYKEDYEGAAALANRARWLRPPSVSAKQNALVALSYRGSGRLSESPRAALDDYRKALTGFEEFRRWDPSNRLWQRERAANQLLVSEGIVTCHTSKTKDCNPMPSLEEAEAVSLEARAALRALAETDLSNVSWQRDLGWALEVHAKVLAVKGCKDDCLAFLEESEVLAVKGCKDDCLVFLEESEKVYSRSQLDKADAASLAEFGRLLQEKSGALAALDRLFEAKEILQRALVLFETLTEAHRDTPIYVSDLSKAYQREAEILQKADDGTGADAAKSEVQRLNAKYETLVRNREEEANKLYARHMEHLNKGTKLFEKSNYTDALSEFNTAEAAIREYIRLQPTDFTGYDGLSDIYDWIQATQEKLDNAEERAEPLSASMHAAHIAAWLTPKDSAYEMTMIDKLLSVMHELAKFLYDNRRLDEALAMVQEEIVVAEGFLQGATQNALYLNRMGDAKCGLGIFRRDLNKAGWEEAIRSGLIHLQKAAEIDTKNPMYQRDLGLWRKIFAERLKAANRNAEAWEEYRLALEDYEEAGRRLLAEEPKAADRIVEAWEEYRLALEAYQEMASRAPGDEKMRETIWDLVEYGIRLRKKILHSQP